MRARDLALVRVRVARDEEARDRRRDIAENREPVGGKQQAEEPSPRGPGEVVTAHRRQEHGRPPERAAEAVHVASRHAALVRVHPGRAGDGHEDREGRDVAEAPPPHDAAERAHASVGAADDAHETRATQRAENAHGAEDTEDSRRREQECDRGEPISPEIGELARGHHELD